MNIESYIPSIPEKRVWQALINQMLCDAGSNSRKEDEQIARSCARSWLLYDSHDFHVVCDHADYDPKLVRAIARYAMRRGYVFRRPPKNRRAVVQVAAVGQLELPLNVPQVVLEVRMVRAPRKRTPAVEWEQLEMDI